jgi:mannose-1-phosphate guanylyltransferase
VNASALDLAVKTGARRLVVNTWHLADHLKAAVDGLAKAEAEIVFSPEDELMGTAGALALARDRGFLGDDGPVLVLNGDGVLGLQLGALIEHHHRSDDHVTLALLPHLDPRRWSRVVLDADSHVDRILAPGHPGRHEVPFLFPGAMAISRPALESLPCRPGETHKLLWAPALEARRLAGVVVSGHWREVGTPADYLEVVGQQLAGKTIFDPSAIVDRDASVVASYVGRGAVIEPGAVVRKSVVAAGAAVRAGAEVRRSVLLGLTEAVADEVVSEEIRAQGE